MKSGEYYSKATERLNSYLDSKKNSEKNNDE
jgi:hypothetical protein